MFPSRPSPTSPRPVPLPAPTEAAQSPSTSATRPATPVHTWDELLANGAQPGQQGPVPLSADAFGGGAKKLPLSLDHEWLGQQNGKLSKDGDALLRSFVTAFKHGSPAAGNRFELQSSPSAIGIVFTHERQECRARCHIHRDGSVLDIAIATTDIPPRQLFLKREGDVRRGDPACFPPLKRSADSTASMHQLLQANAKRLKQEESLDSELNSKILDAYKKLGMDPEGGLDLANVASAVMTGTSHFAALKLLMEEGEILPIDLEQEGEDGTFVLAELLQHLAKPHRPDLSKFMEGQNKGEIPTDRARVELLKELNPFRGRCSDGRSPIDFASNNGMTYVLEVFSTSSNPETQELLAASPSLKLQQQLRRVRINANIGPILLQLKPDDYHNLYELSTDAPFSHSDEFCKGVRNIYSGNSGKAIINFKKVTSGEDISIHASESKLPIQIKSFHNLILIHKKEKLKSEALMQAILEAHRFVRTLPSLPPDELSRAAIAQIYGRIMEQWDDFSTEEKENVFLPEILGQMRTNDVFLMWTEGAFYRALFEPIVLLGKNPALKSGLIEALEQSRTLNADYASKESEKHGQFRVPQDFFNKIEVEEWKNTQEKEKLESMLGKLKACAYFGAETRLRYFELFVHSRDAAAKGEIAKAFVKKAKEEEYLDVRTGRDHGESDASDLLASFAFASMQSHYLLSLQNDWESLRNSRTMEDDHPVLGALEQIEECLVFDCLNTAQRPSVSNPEDRSYKTRQYTDRDRTLIVDLALESISLMTELTSMKTTEALKEGKDESTCQAIDKWSASIRKRIQGAGKDDSPSEGSRAVLQKIAAHARRELTRTQGWFW